MHVLLVEDSPSDARLVSEYLSDIDAGVGIRHVSCIAAACDELRQSASRDVILLDLRLPDVSGLEGLRILRRQAPDVPIVLMTGLDDDRVALQALEEGAQDFIAKDDVDGESLHRSIRYAMERTRAQRQLERHAADLERANLALRNFVATASHELQTPISNLLSAAEILAEHGAAELAETREEFLAIIRSESVRMSRLVQQMLDVAVLESGLDSKLFEPIDLPGLLREIASASSNVVLELPSAALGFAGDRRMLARLFGELLDNAIRMGGDEPIVLSLRANGDTYQMRVADRGPGVPPGRMQAVFEPFHQSDDVLTGKPAGLGLGLTIARLIATAHGGTIECQGNPGGGAVFVVTLPRPSSPRVAARVPGS